MSTSIQKYKTLRKLQRLIQVFNFDIGNEINTFTQVIRINSRTIYIWVAPNSIILSMLTKILKGT